MNLTTISKAVYTDLNEKQIEAVMLQSQSALVLAGAGSGKTRVLTSRISWLIENQLASPGAILAVTFTNKAAKEMLTRISTQLPINIRGMWVGTFHGLCNRFYVSITWMPTYLKPFKFLIAQIKNQRLKE